MLYPALQSAAATLTGVATPGLISSCAEALTVWLPTCGIAGWTTGAAGSGVVRGTLSQVPNPALFLATMQAAFPGGVMLPELAAALSCGLALGITGMQYTGVSAGVGAGVDVSRLVYADPLSLTTILLEKQKMFWGQNGTLTPMLSGAIAWAVANQMATTTGNGTVQGLAGILPGAGATTSSIQPT